MIYLNNIALEGLDQSILVTGFDESEPEEEESVAGSMYPFGSTLMWSRRKSLTVTVKFVIMARGKQQRQQVAEKVQMWGRNGGMLQVSWRQNAKLMVTAKAMPRQRSSEKWLDELECVFVAREIPYWQSTYRATASARGAAEGVLTLLPAGNAPFCLAEVEARFPEGTPERLSIGGITLNLPETGQISAVKITTTPQGLTQITTEMGGDLRPCLGVDSQQQILLKPSEANRLHFSASCPVDITASAVGWYL